MNIFTVCLLCLKLSCDLYLTHILCFLMSPSDLPVLGGHANLPFPRIPKQYTNQNIAILQALQFPEFCSVFSSLVTCTKMHILG